MYILGAKSKANLEGVDYALVNAVERAIQRSVIDFSVVSGYRTVEQQRKLVSTGASKTMDSKHLKGLAVDLVPYIAGRTNWDSNLFYPIVTAMAEAARHEGFLLRWGGHWGVINFTHNHADEVAKYIKGKLEGGKAPFVDMAHFEIKAL